jgi:predicted MPP superfamily phosphohydrolase
MLAARYLAPQTARWVLAGPYYWMALLFLLFFFLLGGDILRGLYWAGGRTGILPDNWLTPEVRLYLRRGIAIVAGAGAVLLTVYGAIHQAQGPVVATHAPRIKSLSPSMEGFRIVQLSDLHIGPTLGAQWLTSVVRQVNAEKPDLVVITGDLTDGTPDMLGPELEPLFSIQATYGIYAVTGNHEYFSNAPAWVEYLEKHGVRVLRNEHVVIQQDGARLCLAGVNDIQGSTMIPGERSDPFAAVQGCPPGTPVILLCHDPRSAVDAAKANVDLVLAGHTHGGQFWPWTWMVGLQQQHRVGFFQLGQTLLYVNPGTGFWGPPVRVGTTSEITSFHLLPDLN